MSDIIGAAQSLVKSLNDIASRKVGKLAPATHAVYVHHDPETQKMSIRVAVNPRFPHEIPETFDGHPIEIVEWPAGL